MADPAGNLSADAAKQLRAEVLASLQQSRSKLLTELQQLAKQQDEIVAARLTDVLGKAITAQRGSDMPLKEGRNGLASRRIPSVSEGDEQSDFDDLPADQPQSPVAGDAAARKWRGARASSATGDNPPPGWEDVAPSANGLCDEAHDGGSPASPQAPTVGVEVAKMADAPYDLGPLVRAARRHSTNSASKGSGSQRPSRNLKSVLPWPVWTEAEADLEPEYAASSRLTKAETETFVRQISNLRAGDQLKDAGCLQRFIARPVSLRKIVWDFLTVVFLSYDMLVIPMAAFELPPNDFTRTLSWMTTVFWTLDLLMSFTVGYHDGGVVEMRPRKIAWNYLRTWFPLDILVTMTDWLYHAVTASGSTTGLLRVGKSMRLMRMLRLLRLLRIWKLMLVINQFSDSLPAESISTLLQVCKMVMGIAYINHVVACGWYAIGTEFAIKYSGYSSSWVNHLEPAEDTTLAYRYSTALHWSLTQFTPASMEVTPKNAWERVFTIVVIFIAMVVFSSVVSTITQGMTQLRNINMKRMEEREKITRYINDKQLSIELGNRIRSFLAKYQNGMKMHVQEADIPCFQAMPEILRLELHSEVFTPLLMPHPFFHHYMQGDEMGIVNICHTMMAERTLLNGKELFLPGKECKGMYFLTGGLAKYFLDAEEERDLAEEVKRGQHMCEMVLWVQWRHLGRLVAEGHCELVTLEANTFRSMLSQMSLHTSCRQYAKLYAEHLQQMPDFMLTDIWYEFDLCQEFAQRAFKSETTVSASSTPIYSTSSTISSAFRTLRTIRRLGSMTG